MILRVLCLWAGAAILLIANPETADAQETTPVQEQGWMGIRFRLGAPGSEIGQGLSLVISVTDVYRGGPADRGGVLPGDRVIAMDGRRLAGWDEWIRLTNALRPGQSLRLRLLRNGDVREATVVTAPVPGALVPEMMPQRFVETEAHLRRTIQTMDSLMRTVTVEASSLAAASSVELIEQVLPATEDQRVIGEDGFAPPSRGGGGPTLRPVETRGRSPFLLLTPGVFESQYIFGGARARALSPVLGRYFGVESGVLITGVIASTPAELAGFLPGDVIVSLGSREPKTVSELRALLTETAPPYDLAVVRKGSRLTIRYPRPR